MSANTEVEDRALNAAELEMVNGTRSPAIGQKTKEELKALAHRLRQAHSRANDITIRQQREIRGKAEPVQTYEVVGLYSHETSVDAAMDSTFVGRQRELAQLGELIKGSPSGFQSATIVAPASAGKSRTCASAWLRSAMSEVGRLCR